MEWLKQSIESLKTKPTKTTKSTKKKGIKLTIKKRTGVNWADLYNNLEQGEADSYNDLDPETTHLEDFLITIIPNKNQPSAVFRAMAYVIKGSGLTLLHYIRWALKCKEYTEDEQKSACEYYWGLIGNAPTRYNLKSLIKVASLYLPNGNAQNAYFHWRFEHRY